LRSYWCLPGNFLLIPATPGLIGWQPPDITNLLQLIHFVALSLSEICWESQWSGCFGMFSTCICQAAKDDKTAFLNCLNYLILGSRLKQIRPVDSGNEYWAPGHPKPSHTCQHPKLHLSKWPHPFGTAWHIQIALLL
jgi:hypothetical protein